MEIAMKIYVFGNQDLEEDDLALEVAHKLKDKIEGMGFIFVKPNQDLPFEGVDHVIILDTVLGIDKVEVLSEDDLDKVTLNPRTSVHDFDLSFQLKYLKKLGKLNKITIIGLPQQGEIDYFLIHSILRKLVAQDIQGS